MDMMNTFTKDEKTILKNTSGKYKWIARDRSGALFVYVRKPKKYINVYGDAGDGAGIRSAGLAGYFRGGKRPQRRGQAGR